MEIRGQLQLRPEDRDNFELTPRGGLFELGEPDILYLNDGHGHFTPMPWTNGVFLDESGQTLTAAPRDWGLSVMLRDMNEDGAPDIMSQRFSQPPFNGQLDHAQREKRWSQSVAELKSSVSTNGFATAMESNLGKLLSAQHRYEESIRHYTTALTLKPDEAMVHYNLANTLVVAQRGGDVLWHYREAVRLNPSLTEGHFNLGVILAKEGNLEEAAKCFSEAVRLDPKDPEAHLYLGCTFAQQRRLPEAITQFREALRLDPHHALAKKYLETALGFQSPTPERKMSTPL